ncbi:SOS inhibition protein PsiB [Rahnella aquatilis]|nr:SOS inhibition protein PsiB [Rahnella aquatilis]
MKNRQPHFLANILGCQPAGAEMPLELRGNVRQMFTDSVLQNVDLPAAWSVDVPAPCEEGFLSTCCVLTAASGIRLIFGHGGRDAPFWSMGLLFDNDLSVAWLFVSEVIDNAAIAAIGREIQRIDEYVHAGYTGADRLATALRFTGVAV